MKGIYALGLIGVEGRGMGDGGDLRLRFECGIMVWEDWLEIFAGIGKVPERGDGGYKCVQIQQISPLGCL